MSRYVRAGLLVLLVSLLSAPVHAGEEAPAPDKSPRWVRVVRDAHRDVGLEVAVRRFGPKDGKGPIVGLIGVVHVGEPAFYHALQQVLNRYDVVLYESVKPDGAGAPGGDTVEERVASTRSSLRFVASLVEACRNDTKSLPESLDALRLWLHARNVRLADIFDACRRDAWGGRILYRRETAPDGSTSFTLESLGADRRAGGEGESADLDVGTKDAVPPFAPPKGDSLQSDLANALHLKFQLDEIDYSADNWRSCDMSMDQVVAAIKARGGDPDELMGTLSGASLTAGFARIVLGLVRFGDLLTGGMFSDAMKVVMIEMLGDESLEAGGALDDATMKAIIQDRNHYVMDDLVRLVEREPALGSIAVFYGAGHMKDLEARLEKRLGYVPLDEKPRWFRAFGVDLEKSHLSPDMVEALRRTIRSRLEGLRGR